MTRREHLAEWMAKQLGADWRREIGRGSFRGHYNGRFVTATVYVTATAYEAAISMYQAENVPAPATGGRVRQWRRPDATSHDRSDAYAFLDAFITRLATLEAELRTCIEEAERQRQRDAVTKEANRNLLRLLERACGRHDALTVYCDDGKAILEVGAMKLELTPRPQSQRFWIQLNAEVDILDVARMAGALK